MLENKLRLGKGKGFELYFENDLLNLIYEKDGKIITATCNEITKNTLGTLAYADRAIKMSDGRILVRSDDKLLVI